MTSFSEVSLNVEALLTLPVTQHLLCALRVVSETSNNNRLCNEVTLEGFDEDGEHFSDACDAAIAVDKKHFDVLVAVEDVQDLIDLLMNS